MTLSLLESYMIYIFTFIVSALFASLYGKKRGFKKYVFFSLAILIPALLAAIRGIEVGTDYWAYLRHIYEMTNNIDSLADFDTIRMNFEFGYNFLVYLLTRLTDNILFDIFLIYIFMNFIVLKALERLIGSKYLFLGYLFYLSGYWLLGFNILRESIAIVIVLYSFTYIKNKKLVPFILTAIFATLFHKTAILVVPLYVIYSKNSTYREYIYFFVVVLSILLSSFFLGEISNFSGYSHYMTDKYVKDGSVGALAMILLSVLLISPFFLLQKSLTKTDSFQKFYFKTLYLYIFIKFLSFQIPLLTRLNFYYEIILIPIAIEFFKTRNKYTTFTRHFFIAYIFFYFIIYKLFYTYFFLKSGQVIPYSFFQLKDLILPLKQR